MGPGDYHNGNVPATDGGELPPRKVVRSAIVWVVRVRIVRVWIEAIPEEGPVEALKPPTALEPLMTAPELMPELVPAMKTGRATEPVPTTPS